MLRVLHLGKYYPPHMGGMETHLQDLVTYQSRQMHVEVIVSNDAMWTQEESVDGATITRLGAVGVLASMPICPTLTWTIRQRRADLIHLHLPNPAAALALLMSGHRGRIVITHHGDTLGRHNLRKLSDPFVRIAMERAAAIVVSSKRYLDSSEELKPFLGKCHIIPLGINPEDFRRGCQGEANIIRQQYSRRLIVAVGRLVPYKGFDCLIESMVRIDAQLLIVGTGRLEGELRQLIRDFGVADKVCLVGHVKDVRPYYEAAECLVLPSVSRAESFGMVQLEAMASGIPVVNTDIDSGVPEVSIHGETGLTVPPRDAEALAQSINLLLNDAETRIKFGLAAAARVEREFTTRAMVERTLRLYEAVLIGGPQRGFDASPLNV